MQDIISKSLNGKVEIDLDYTSLNSVLKYIYCGKCKVNPNNIHKIIKAADVLGVKELRKSCFDYLVSSLDKNTVTIMIMRAKNKEFSFNSEDLIKSCYKFIEANTSDVFETEGFKLFDEDIIKDLVQCENLTILEFDLFKAILEWGENYISIILSLIFLESKRTTKSQYDLLKDIMKYIRYPLIDSYDLKFFCRETKLVPNDLYIQALEFNGNILFNL
jgi:hypothetical protein